MTPTTIRRIAVLGPLSLMLAASPALADGGITLNAQRTATPPRIDGHLDEQIWSTAPVARDFVQQRPEAGEPARAQTEVHVLYDAEALYFGFICHDPDPQAIVHQLLGRDADIDSDDYLAIVLDSFLDRQNGYVFAVNPNGVKRDIQFRNEGDADSPEWDAIWSAEVLITDRGWQGEIAIPWRSLRFPRGEIVNMGLNFQRQQRSRNEQSLWSPVERQYDAMRVSSAGVLEGLEGIHPGRNVLVRPYALGRVSRGDAGDTESFDSDDWDAFGDLGLDVRAGLGPEFTLDLTLNTDFAQVESDDIEINFTRFELEFPEKREFFLEKQDLFTFGSPGNAPFFSRRIGLDEEGAPVPIEYGARLTGKVGRTEIGVLDMSTAPTDSDPGRRFDVLRLSRDLGARSRVGFIGVQRNDLGNSLPINRTLGLDADIRPTEELDIAAFAATLQSGSLGDDDFTATGRIRYTNPLLSLTYYHETIGRDYQPAAGFVPRGNVDQDAIGWSWTPEPNWGWIRRSDSHGRVEWTDRRGDKGDSESGFESRFIHIHPVAVGHHDERLGVFYNRSFDRLYAPFQRGELVFSPGDYDMNEIGWNFHSDPGRALSFGSVGHVGDFFDATRRAFDTRIVVRHAPHLEFGLELENSRIERDDLHFDTDLLRLRLGYAFSNALRADLFTQWDSRAEQMLSQLRVHMLFGDESDLFLVLNDLRSDDHGDFAPLRSEGIVKLAYARQL